MSQQAFNTQQAYTSEDRAIQKEGRAALMPKATALAENTGYSDELKQRLNLLTQNNGYSPQEQSAIEQDTVGATSSAFGKAREGMARRVATTGNSAGYGGASAELAREEAKAVGETTRGNKLAFANEARSRSLQNYGLQQGAEDEAQRRSEQGTNLLARLYGIDTGAFQSGRSEANAPMENFSKLASMQSPWFDVLRAAISGGAQVASGGLK